MHIAVAPTPKFLLRLPPDVRDQLGQIAHKQRRSLTNLIVFALTQWLAGRGYNDSETEQ